MTEDEFLTKIWSYYLMLEEDFINTFRYVEPCDDNNNCYSKEFGKLLLSICSEVDIICRELCKRIENKNDEDVKKYNIINYKNIIFNYNSFNNESCTFLLKKEVLKPFDEWNNNDNLKWWKDYNSLKHNRLFSTNYKLGNYINIKMALSALYILCRFYYKENYNYEPMQKSKIFIMNGWRSYTKEGENFMVVDEGNCISHYYIGE